MKLKIVLFVACLSCFSCKKYLDEVSNRSLAIISTVEEYQQLLDEEELYLKAPGIMEYGIDDFYLLYDNWYSNSTLIKNAYVWEKDIYAGGEVGGTSRDWKYPYEAIYYANVALEGLKQLDLRERNKDIYKQVEGHAYFLRAFQFYLLQEIFGQPFKPASSSVDLGIPLKLTSNLTEPIARATVKETFDQIVKDLKDAAHLLQNDYEEVNKYRPSKATAYAMLSRVYLTMQDYEQSLIYSNKCLDKYNKLLDYNQLGPAYTLPSPDNIEVLFAHRQVTNGRYVFFREASTIVDSVLYGIYDESDLRKKVFFKVNYEENTPFFNSLYNGSSFAFAGIAIDEVYLNRAECRARLGDTQGALDDINTLLKNRYVKGSFVPLVAADINDPLAKVLEERRKQMVIRGTRWSDLRRLNQESDHSVTLKRVLNGREYILEPNSSRYTFQIPKEEVLRNDLIQNER
jgi:hypothetical protein